MANDVLEKNQILRVGEVSQVSGRNVHIKVEKNKNLSELFFDGDIVKNIAVNSYIEIRKGFLSIIGKVDGENIEEDKNISTYETNLTRRFLSVSLVGYISRDGIFRGGIKELPLIGNRAYIVTKEKIHQIHKLVDDNSLSVVVATSDSDDFDMIFPVDGLFNSHIAIFGNTGSGKSNTLTALYQELVKVLETRNSNAFKQNTQFLLFDFNGEYSNPKCITTQKKVYDLSTSKDNGDKLPFDPSELLEIEMLSILSDATEKTQKPFLSRTLSLLKSVSNSDDPDIDYFQNLIRKALRETLSMSDKPKVDLLLDSYIMQILVDSRSDVDEFDLRSDLEWHGSQSTYKERGTTNYFSSNSNAVTNTKIYEFVSTYQFPSNLLSKFIHFMYIQLVRDVLSNRAQNEHIAPVINRLKSKRTAIDRVFDTSADNETFWEKNFVVINLNDTNLEMKKTLPLLLSKKIYSEHKRHNNQKSLTIIIDEAHNILSRESFRESETWKDYRLETFEEIIKEGRKFGVFVTISSQRPNDISPTITSQAHNYFIHRLINQRDLATISSAVSYIDKIMEDSIPTLPTGTCIFSGVASQRPIKINVVELPKEHQPKSSTLRFAEVVPEIEQIRS